MYYQIILHLINGHIWPYLNPSSVPGGPKDHI